MTKRQPVVEIIDLTVVESLQRLSPAQKLAQAFGMWDFAISLMTASIQQDHPEWSAGELQEEILRRLGRSVSP